MIYVAIFAVLMAMDPVLSGAARHGRFLARARLLAVLLFVFAGFRYEVGCDWAVYEQNLYALYTASLSDIDQHREPGFALLNILVRKYELPFYVVNVVTSALFFIGFYSFAKRQNSPVSILVLAFPVLIINMPMSGIRQAVAVGFVAMAFTAFVDRRVLRYVLFLILAATFHTSALVFLCLVPLMFMRATVLSIGLSALLAAPGVYYMMQDRFEIYVGRYLESSIDAAGAPFRTATLALAAMIFFVYLRKTWKKEFARDYDLTVVSSYIMLATFALSFAVPVMADRLGYYLMPIQLSIFARIYFLSPGVANTHLLKLVPYVALLSLLVIWMGFSGLFQGCFGTYRSVLLQFL